jgi:protoheme IX farnesyltransferase
MRLSAMTRIGKPGRRRLDFAASGPHVRWSAVSDITAPTPTAAPSVERSRVRRLTASARAYFLLTKPRVIELLLVTTVPAMVLAEGGIPELGLLGAVLLGGGLAAGGANTINCWIERERDQVMRRTRARPLPAGDIDPRRALIFGIALELGAFALLWTGANLLAATLAVGATLFYVFVYTIWLKPRSPQNIVIGGAAGAVPALVGWAAVTGSLAAPAWVLFAIVFFWTPPHFWALAMRYRDDYAAAGIPMLPVVKGMRAAVVQILAYAVVVVVVSLVLPLTTTMTPLYPIAAAALGALFVHGALRLRREPTAERAIGFFMFSNTYLALLFAVIAVDTLIA